MYLVRKKKFRFTANGHRMEIDVYPFSSEKAILFIYGAENNNAAVIPDGITVLKDVTGNPEYKNRRLAGRQEL